MGRLLGLGILQLLQLQQDHLTMLMILLHRWTGMGMEVIQLRQQQGIMEYQ